jgi:hypothetical protein
MMEYYDIQLQVEGFVLVDFYARGGSRGGGC